MSQVYKSLSIANPEPLGLSAGQKLFSAIGIVGLGIIVLAGFGMNFAPSSSSLILSILLMIVGIVGYAYVTYRTEAPGIKNNGIQFSGTMSRGLLGWTLGILMTCLLYTSPSPRDRTRSRMPSSA